MIRKILAAALFALSLGALGIPPAHAVDPSERLADPGLEARARKLSQQLRCLVCQNQSIDDSAADLAHDLRVRLRERLLAGDTDKQALDYLVARYGTFVLLDPPWQPETYLLWTGPGLLVVGGASILLWRMRKRRFEAGAGETGATLSPEEAMRAARLLEE